MILALLARRAMSGYELMHELDRLFGPRYAASAGSVYPALAALETEGLIEPVDKEMPKRLQLSAIGEEALSKRQPALAEFELRTGTYLRPDDSIEAELDRLARSLSAAQGKVAPAELVRALRSATSKVRELRKKSERR